MPNQNNRQAITLARVLLLFISCICTKGAFAQSGSTLITGNFINYSFDSLAKELSQKTGLIFYYDPSETDSVIVNLQAKDMSLAEVLQNVFESKQMKFSFDDFGRVFINKRFDIITLLPKEIDGKKPSGDLSILPTDKYSPADENKKSINADLANRIFEIGNKNTSQSGNTILSGYVKDIRNGEVIDGAILRVEGMKNIFATDQFGYFSITLPKGRQLLKVSSNGMKEARRQLLIYSDGKLDIELAEAIVSLTNVVINAEKKVNTQSLQMGVNKLSIKAIRQVPVVFGETDILKVVLTLPGVTSAGEAANGFNVRGGSSDQNLLLLNGSTIFNPTHLFGFFSAFNADCIKGMELYKSSIPEKFGGRISSVLDVSMQEGNTKKWTGTAGIGPLTSKLTFEGPIKKEKTSLIVGARTTYSNWLLQLLPDKEYRNSSADFYDANLQLSHKLNSKNNFYLTGYISNDRFRLNNDTAYQYRNQSINLRWKHLFNNTFQCVNSAGLDDYSYSISSNAVAVNAFKLGFGINQVWLKSEFTYAPSNKHKVNIGINATYYSVRPGSFLPKGQQSLVTPNTVQSQQALETAIYLGDVYTISPNLSINAGVRFSFYQFLGPQKVNRYLDGIPRDTFNIVSTDNYGSGKIIKSYGAPEIRLSLRYSLPGDASIKIGFNTLQQYIHMLSNTVSISPTDIWTLSGPYIRPQKGRQLSFGFYKNFSSNTIETSFEAYYKWMDNFLDYKSSAELLLNKNIETDIINTRGKAYGIELLVKKTTGRLNGWFSYTYSRTLLQQDDPLAGESINKGKYYPASFDRPHVANLICNYRFSHRINLSVNLVYNTGRPVTLPIAAFDAGNVIGLIYSDRNEYRIPDYLRTDISLNIYGNHKVKQKTHNSWSIGVYNATARKNVYSVYYTVEDRSVKGYQLSVFGTAIPFISYNVKF